MNDLFFKFIEKLGSIDNSLLFAVSIIPYAIFLFYLVLILERIFAGWAERS